MINEWLLKFIGIRWQGLSEELQPLPVSEILPLFRSNSWGFTSIHCRRSSKPNKSRGLHENINLQWNVFFIIILLIFQKFKLLCGRRPMHYLLRQASRLGVALHARLLLQLHWQFPADRPKLSTVSSSTERRRRLGSHRKAKQGEYQLISGPTTSAGCFNGIRQWLSCYIGTRGWNHQQNLSTHNAIYIHFHLFIIILNKVLNKHL